MLGLKLNHVSKRGHGSNPYKPFFAKWIGVLYLFYTPIPKFDYNISCKDIWMSKVKQIFQRFIAEYFSSLDYNPDTASDLSTHKWYIIFPTQFIVNNHNHFFLFINFSNDFPINLLRYTRKNITFSWEKHEMCLLYIQRLLINFEPFSNDS